MVNWLILLLPLGYGAIVLTRILADDRHQTAARRAQIAARNEYFAQHDPHCDGCAAKAGGEPVRPVTRCVKCMSCMAGLIGDPLFGFDFEKHGGGK